MKQSSTEKAALTEDAPPFSDGSFCGKEIGMRMGTILQEQRRTLEMAFVFFETCIIGIPYEETARAASCLSALGMPQKYLQRLHLLR